MTILHIAEPWLAKKVKELWTPVRVEINDQGFDIHFDEKKNEEVKIIYRFVDTQSIAPNNNKAFKK